MGSIRLHLIVLRYLGRVRLVSLVRSLRRSCSPRKGGMLVRFCSSVGFSGKFCPLILYTSSLECLASAKATSLPTLARDLNGVFGIREKGFI